MNSLKKANALVLVDSNPEPEDADFEVIDEDEQKPTKPGWPIGPILGIIAILAFIGTWFVVDRGTSAINWTKVLMVFTLLTVLGMTALILFLQWKGDQRWKSILTAAGVLAIAVLVVWAWDKRNDTADAEKVEAAVTAAAEARLKARRCAESPWIEGCTPEDTVFTKVVLSGGEVTVPIPPRYRLDWWGECGKFHTKAERSGVMLLQKFSTTQGVESTTLTFHLYKPSNPYEQSPTDCDDNGKPPRRKSA